MMILYNLNLISSSNHVGNSSFRSDSIVSSHFYELGRVPLQP